MNLVKNFLKHIFPFFLGAVFLFSAPSETQAKIDIAYENDIPLQRSLESLRDLDFQTWQVVAYPKERKDNFITLRIVGYPGSLRLNHPEDLIVKSGIKEWKLKDITLENVQLANDSREAAVEFDLEPLLLDLTQNRPLRLFLPNGFNELPVPPYLVKEWRSLKINDLKNEKI